MNRHQDFKISELKTWEQCHKAIELIEQEPENIQGGLKAWCSGSETYLTKGAERKVEAITGKMHKILATNEFENE